MCKINTHTQYKWCEKPGRNPDRRVIITNYVCKYLTQGFAELSNIFYNCLDCNNADKSRGIFHGNWIFLKKTYGKHLPATIITY